MDHDPDATIVPCDPPIEVAPGAPGEILIQQRDPMDNEVQVIVFKTAFAKAVAAAILGIEADIEQGKK